MLILPNKHQSINIIPIPDSLGEEASLIKICINNGSLKCHRALISTTPSFGDKVIDNRLYL